MKNIVRNIFILILLVISSDITSQSRAPRGVMDRGGSSSQNTVNELPDTIILKYFKLSDITKSYDFKDSTLDNFFHLYDPAKRRWIDYQTLGNPGSAARNQIYNSNPYVGFDVGQNQYSLYNFKLDDFRFYDNNVPMTDVFFTPINGQQNFVIKSDFARKFSDGTSLSLNYRRIRQTGYYTNQLTKNTNFGVSFKFQSDNKKYTGFASIISNVNEEGQNGGVQSDTTETFFLDSQLETRTNVPVNSEDAQTRHQQKQYSLINYYQLNKPDSSKVQLLLRYDFKYDSRYYKFNDEITNSSLDTLHYGNYLTEGRGIKVFTKVNKISNAFYAYVSDSEKLNIRAGLVYDRYDIDQLGIGSSYNNLFADFKGDIPITESISISTSGQLGLGDGAGDFVGTGSLKLDIGEWINLNGGASFYRYTPNLISRELVINGQPVSDFGYNNDFTKPIGTDLFGSFEIPKLKLSGKIKQSLVTNAIFFDENVSPTQAESVFSATTLSVANEFKFWKMGMDNYLMLQVFSENLYNLPNFYSKHNLYIQGWMFDKALFARLGVETRLSPTHTGAGFSPVTGTFYRSNKDLPFYPMTDVYFSGKVKTFRIFARVENATKLITNKVQYQIANYPQFDFKIRLGFSWLLFN